MLDTCRHNVSEGIFSCASMSAVLVLLQGRILGLICVAGAGCWT